VRAVRLDAFRSRSDGTGADRDIAARSWDLARLERDYTEFVQRYEGRLAGYRAGEVRGQNALTERMYLIHDYRMFPFRDPDLPPELVPSGWPGRQAHEMFLEAHGLLRGPAEAYVDELVGATATSRKASRSPAKSSTV
jgi:phenylacetic acid degradation operon negative regulatory protein